MPADREPIPEPIDSMENPVGAAMQVFFEGKMPDGSPLDSDLRTALGADLIDFLSDSNDFKEHLAAQRRRIEESVENGSL